MKCPKCEYIQDDNNIECLSCGVIFSKIYKKTPINAYTPLDAKDVKVIRDLNNMLNNESDNLKNIYKSIKIGLVDLPINSNINTTDRSYYIKLIKNKLSSSTHNKKFSFNIFLAVFILMMIGFIFFLL